MLLRIWCMGARSSVTLLPSVGFGGEDMGRQWILRSISAILALMMAQRDLRLAWCCSHLNLAVSRLWRPLLWDNSSLSTSSPELLSVASSSVSCSKLLSLAANWRGMSALPPSDWAFLAIRKLLLCSWTIPSCLRFNWQQSVPSFLSSSRHFPCSPANFSLHTLAGQTWAVALATLGCADVVLGDGVNPLDTNDCVLTALVINNRSVNTRILGPDAIVLSSATMTFFSFDIDTLRRTMELAKS